jgi:lipid-A-disaccharide synthase
MLIAGEPSGDILAAELVRDLRAGLLRHSSVASTDLQPLHTAVLPQFFGAGGSHMAAEGVEITVDLTVHAVVGLVEVLKNVGTFKRLFKQLLALAIERRPDVIVCVDFSGFNRRFAHAIKRYVRSRQGAFRNWNPKIVQYVSPQVWASREGRAHRMAQDFDLVLSIFPFEKTWYAERVPSLRVEYVGHPIIDRYHIFLDRVRARKGQGIAVRPVVLLLPGSRPGELKRHWPVMLATVRRIAKSRAVQIEAVLPNEGLAETARLMAGSEVPEIPVKAGGLAEALLRADLALASTGTVTMECAYFGVPTLAMYITSWSTYQIGKRIIKVEYLAMPNLLANESVFPEFLQQAATPERIAHEALVMLDQPDRCTDVRRKLQKIMESLGTPGASQRAADAIIHLLRG